MLPSLMPGLMHALLDSPSESDDERVGGGYANTSPLKVMGLDSGGGTDAEAGTKLLASKSDKRDDKAGRPEPGGVGSPRRPAAGPNATSGSAGMTGFQSHGDEPVFYPRREYYRYNFE